MANPFVDNQERNALKKPDRARYAGLLPVLLLIALVIGLWLHSVSTAIYEPPLLLPILNTVFLFLVSCIVAYVAMRGYLLSGSLTILLLGCGVLTLGTGALAAGWLIGPEGPNVNVTIFNVAVLLSSVLHASGVVVNLWQAPPEADVTPRRHKLLTGYLGVPAFVVLLSLAGSAGLLPPFFVQDVGPTALRQTVLVIALVLFVSSSSYIMSRFMQERRGFFYWYSLALALLAVMLIGALLQPAVGSPLGWVSRIAEYVAGIYFLLSVNAALREARIRGVSANGAIAELFKEGETRRILEAMMDNIPVGIGLTGGPPDFPLLKVSRAGWEMMGGPKPGMTGMPSGQHQQAWGIVLTDGTTTPEREEMPLYRASRFGERVTNSELMIKRADGTPIPVLVDAAPIRDDNGHIVGAVNCWRDMTDRKQAEEEIRESLDAVRKNEEQLRVLIQNLRSGVALIDEAGKFSVVNGAFLRMFGLDSESDILNVNSQDWSRWEVCGEDGKLLHVDDHPVRKAVSTGKPVISQLVAVRNPGANEPTWMLINAEPLLREDGTVYTVVSTYYDITERKQIEEELRRSRDDLELRVRERTESLRRQAEALSTSEKKFRMLAEAMPQIVWITDADGLNIYFNQQWVDYTGSHLRKATVMAGTNRSIPMTGNAPGTPGRMR